MARREQDRVTEDKKFSVRTWIIESAKEMQEWQKFAPESSMLPSTHEHFVTYRKEQVGAQALTMIDMGVRLRADAPAGNPARAGLESLDDSNFEFEAVRRGYELVKARKAKKAEAVTA